MAIMLFGVDAGYIYSCFQAVMYELVIASMFLMCWRTCRPFMGGGSDVKAKSQKVPFSARAADSSGRARDRKPNEDDSSGGSPAATTTPTHRPPQTQGAHQASSDHPWRKSESNTQLGASVARRAERIMKVSGTQYTQSLHLYRDMVRSGEDKDIREDAFYLNMVLASVRCGNHDAVSQLLIGMKRNGVTPGLPFLQSVLKVLAAKRLFLPMISLARIFGHTLPADKTVVSCLAFAVAESGDVEALDDILAIMGKDPQVVTDKDCVNLLRVFSRRHDADGSFGLLQKLQTLKIRICTSRVPNVVLLALVSAGEVTRARQVMDDIIAGRFGDVRPDVVSYNIMLKGHKKDADLSEFLNVLEEMTSVGVTPDDETYSTLLDGWLTGSSVHQANALIDHIVLTGKVKNTIVLTKFIQVLSRAGMLDAAMRVFQAMKMRKEGTPTSIEQVAVADLVTYTVLIRCLCDARQFEKAVGVWDELLRSGTPPDSVVVTALLEGSQAKRRVAENIFKDAIEIGVKPCTYMLLSMVKMYGRCDKVDEALEFLQGIKEKYSVEPTVIMYTCLMSGCIRHGRYAKAVEAFKKLKRTGLQLDGTAYSTAIEACKQIGDWELAVKIVQDSFLQRVELSSNSLNELIARMLRESSLATAQTIKNIMDDHNVTCTIPEASIKLQLPSA